MLREWEHFKSNRADLVVFPGLLAVVSREEADEAVSGAVRGLATHAATAALGPIGLLASVVANFDEIAGDAPVAPELDRIPLEELHRLAEPTKLLQGQVPTELFKSERWPYVEWFRPVYVFPRAHVIEIRVKWTSSVVWQTPQHGQWSTEIHFWKTGRLRRVLTEWAYPVLA
jgi:hypothetical protein